MKKRNNWNRIPLQAMIRLLINSKKPNPAIYRVRQTVPMISCKGNTVVFEVERTAVRFPQIWVEPEKYRLKPLNLEATAGVRILGGRR